MSVRSVSDAVRFVLLAAVLILPQISWSHVTLQTNQPLRPGASFSNVTLNVPNERHVDNTKITLTIPEAFLKAGGRLNRLIYPQGWMVGLEKHDKPADVYGKEKESRAKREAERQQQGGAEHDTSTAKTEEEKQEQQAMDELRKKWITGVTFEGGAIPPDGFQQFQLSFQMPEEPGRYRFAAVQTYADGKEVSWSELVEGAEHPAATLNVIAPPWINYSDLPVPLAVLALLIAIASYFKKSGATANEKSRPTVSVQGQLASVGSQDAR